jgi:hypothetical protein
MDELEANNAFFKIARKSIAKQFYSGMLDEKWNFSIS